MSKAYGRLDVFWPDGRLGTFVLRDDSITVGRAEDCGIVLDHDAVDLIHLRITRRPEGAGLVSLSAEQGTYVDSMLLPQDEAVVLLGGEEIQIGSLRAAFRRVDDSPTSPLAVVVEDTQRIIRESAPFRIELQLPQISVTPGSYITVEISITNTSPEPETYQIEVSGLNPDWVRFNRPTIEIDSGDTGLVMMNIRPMRRSDSLPGEYPVAIVVRPETNTSQALRAMLKVRVLPFVGMGIALGGYRFTRGAPFRLHIHNHGSASMALRLSARDPHDRLSLKLSQAFAQLEPGDRLVVSGSASPRDLRLFGAPRDIPFEIVARADMLPAFTVAVPGVIADKPPLPAWSRLVVTLGGLVALLLIAWGIWGLVINRPVTPVITRFVVADGAAELARGLPLRVEWDVQDAERVTLQVGSAEPETLPERGAGVRELVTEGLSGSIVLRLSAFNGEQTVSRETSLQIYLPATVSELTVSPAFVLRNVVQTLSIHWTAQGYVSPPLLTGLNVLGQQAQIPLDESMMPFMFVALPQQDFTVRLSVLDERGQESVRTADIALSDPQCTVARPVVPAFAEPDDTGLPIDLLDQGVARIVIGRDETSQYVALQIRTEGPLWVRASDLACPVELFRISDLRVILPVPNLTAPAPTLTQEPPPLRVLETATPTPTLTPSLTPTPLPTETPLPTNTPVPSMTPLPSATLAPTTAAPSTPLP